MANQVSRRLLINGLLVIVIAVLVYFIEYQPTSKTTALNASHSLFSIARYQAERIAISRIDKDDVVIIKNNEEWQLLKPAIAPLNADRIKHLLTILDEPIISSYDSVGKDLNTFGLSPSKIGLTISAGKKSEKVAFGNTNPITFNRYVLKDGTIFTIKEIIYGVLGTSVTQFLSHHLIPSNMKVINIDAPPLFAKLPLGFWKDVQAVNISDESVDDVVIGKIKITLNDISNGKAQAHIVVFNILSIKPSLVLGRSDLKIKYAIEHEF